MTAERAFYFALLITFIFAEYILVRAAFRPPTYPNLELHLATAALLAAAWYTFEVKRHTQPALYSLMLTLLIVVGLVR